MIRCNLAVLLAERGLSITKASKDTGISRNTLSAFANNTNRMMQYETLSKLCIYLNVYPHELLVFYPREIREQRLVLTDSEPPIPMPGLKEPPVPMTDRDNNLVEGRTYDFNVVLTGQDGGQYKLREYEACIKVRAEINYFVEHDSKKLIQAICVFSTGHEDDHDDDLVLRNIFKGMPVPFFFDLREAFVREMSALLRKEFEHTVETPVLVETWHPAALIKICKILGVTEEYLRGKTTVKNTKDLLETYTRGITAWIDNPSFTEDESEELMKHCAEMLGRYKTLINVCADVKMAVPPEMVSLKRLSLKYAEPLEKGIVDLTNWIETLPFYLASASELVEEPATDSLETLRELRMRYAAVRNPEATDMPDLPESERQLLAAYHYADDGTRSAVDKLLDLKTERTMTVKFKRKKRGAD